MDSSAFSLADFPDRILFHFPDVSLSGQEEPMKHKPRHTAHLVHFQKSKSGGWMILRDDEGRKFFAHRKSFLDPGTQPAIGWNVTFTILPPLPGEPLRRATEISIVKANRGGQITVERCTGATRLVLINAGQTRVIGELQL
jgi:hypothetical protein